MAHRPGRFGGGAALYPFTARKGDFVAISFIRLTGFKDKSGLALRRTFLATVWAPPRSAKSGKGKDDIEVAVFTGDFIECHGGLLLLGDGVV